MKVVRYSVSHTGRLYPTNIPGPHFHERLSRSQRLGAVGRQYVNEKFNVNTGIRLRERPTSSAAPQQPRHPRSQVKVKGISNDKLIL